MAKTNFRKEARDRDCQVRIPGVCNGDPATTVLGHLPGGGLARKRHDLCASWVCSSCHDALDGRGKSSYTREALSLMHHEGMARTIEMLAAEGKL